MGVLEGIYHIGGKKIRVYSHKISKFDYLIDAMGTKKIEDITDEDIKTWARDCQTSPTFIKSMVEKICDGSFLLKYFEGKDK